MAKIALNGATISQSTASGHINYNNYEVVGTGGGGTDSQGNSIPTYPIYGWVARTTSANINGTVDADVTNVFIQGKNPIVNGDNTIETDSYSIPSSGVYTGGAHTNSTNGKVTSGNTKNVFVNGKSVSVEGSTISTHAGNSSSIINGFSSTVFIG